MKIMLTPAQWRSTNLDTTAAIGRRTSLVSAGVISLVAAIVSLPAVAAPPKPAETSPKGESNSNASLTVQPAMAPLKHFAGVTCARFNPDGRRVLTASLDNGARLWDSATGKLLTDLSEHDDRVLYAEFSPDGRRFLTASADDTARVWNADTGDWVTGPMQHAADVLFAHFSPDGRTVVTVCHDKTVRLWSAATGEPTSGPLSHFAQVSATAFHLNASRQQTVVTASVDGFVRRWRTPDGQAMGDALTPNPAPGPMELSPDGRMLLSLGGKDNARLYNLEEGRAVSELKAAPNTVLARFSSDGRRVVTADASGTLRTWDATRGVEVGSAITNATAVTSAAFSKDGNWLATGHRNGALHLHSLHNNKRTSKTALQHTNAIEWVEFSGGGKSLVTGSLDGMAVLWRITR